MLSLALLAAIWGEHRLLHLPDGDPTAYHDSVRAAASLIPERVGDWVGTRVRPPESAVALLKPNVLEGRDFRNEATGERATVLVVQCRDARDMTGHFPPSCYPSHGWTLQESNGETMVAGGRTIPVTVYRFTKESMDRYEEIVVYNFFVRPSGTFDDGSKGTGDAAFDPRTKHFGAAQVQVTFTPAVASERRSVIASTLVDAVFPVIEAILRGRSQ